MTTSFFRRLAGGIAVAFLLSGLSSVALAQTTGTKPATGATTAVKEISWDDLISEKWVKEMQAEMTLMGRLGFLEDGTEAANKAMSKLRDKWNAAPIVNTYLNQRVRLPGYVVPLDGERHLRREFLLVPYFGACIHYPPPPANQMMLVQPTANSRIRAVPESMAAVRVEGTLREARLATSQGVAGYILEAESVRPYEEPTPRGR
jgi:hypothetical protein